MNRYLIIFFIFSSCITQVQIGEKVMDLTSKEIKNALELAENETLKLNIFYPFEDLAEKDTKLEIIFEEYKLVMVSWMKKILISEENIDEQEMISGYNRLENNFGTPSARFITSKIKDIFIKIFIENLPVKKRINISVFKKIYEKY